MSTLKLSSGLTLETGLISAIIKDTIENKRKWWEDDELFISHEDDFNIVVRYKEGTSYNVPVVRFNVFARENGRDTLRVYPDDLLWTDCMKLKDAIMASLNKSAA